TADGVHDAMQGSYLGPAFSDTAIAGFLTGQNIPSVKLADAEIPVRVAELIAAGKVVGWFDGRMEFGPRALGARSILGDARSAEMQSLMNRKIKFRESFRPFAPSVLAERAADYFALDRESPYMLLTAPVLPSVRRLIPAEARQHSGLAKLQVVRSEIPAVTHVDYSARVQTVAERDNPRYYRLLQQFGHAYGCPVIINTSFNVRGEPIVCTPQDAYRCFMRTNMDYLLLGSFLLDKRQQPEVPPNADWQQEFELD
ncbi:MAG: hypothetical protein EPN26_10460, partial [Rhodospirillales bacterium]